MIGCYTMHQKNEQTYSQSRMQKWSRSSMIG